MKKVLFVGDSHLFRIEIAFKKMYGENPPFDAAFFCAPGPLNNLVNFVGGQFSFVENMSFLRSRRKASEFDFISWYEKAKSRYDDIEQRYGVDVNDYAAIVIVGFQIFIPEVWAETALMWSRGQVSKRLFRRYCSETYSLNEVKAPSNHFKLLGQLRDANVETPTFSVAAPPRSQSSDFPKKLLLSGETGGSAFRKAEQNYAQLIATNYRSQLISCPDELLSDDGFCTALRFQLSLRDFRHISQEGSQILLDAILRQLRNQPSDTLSEGAA